MLIPTTFLAMDPKEQKEEIHYTWACNPKITCGGRRVEWPSATVTMNVAQSTIADLKRAIAKQWGNRNFDLDIYFSLDRLSSSETDIETIKALLPNCTVHRLDSYRVCAYLDPIIDPNIVEITCEDSTALETLMNAGNALVDSGISHPIFKAIPK
jgi:hypothetical protein